MVKVAMEDSPPSEVGFAPLHPRAMCVGLSNNPSRSTCLAEETTIEIPHLEAVLKRRHWSVKDGAGVLVSHTGPLHGIHSGGVKISDHCQHQFGLHWLGQTPEVSQLSNGEGRVPRHEARQLARTLAWKAHTENRSAGCDTISRPNELG